MLRVGEDLLGRAVPEILEETGLHGTSPYVLVHREGRRTRHIDRQVPLLGIGDRLLPGPGEVPYRRDHVEVRNQRTEPHLETNLIIALSGAAVCHCGRTVLFGR